MTHESRTFALAFLFLCLLVCVFFHPLLSFERISVQDDIASSDFQQYHVPPRAYFGQSLKSGRFPIWTERIDSGFPFCACIEYCLYYPVTIVLYGGFGLVVAQNLALVFPFFLVALGTLLLARRLGLGWGGSLLAAISYTFSGPFIHHMRLPNMAHAASWIPLLLYFLESYLASARIIWALALTGAFGLQVLAAHPQITHQTVLLLVFYLVLRRLMEGGAPLSWTRFRERILLWRGTWILGLLLVLGLALGAVQILPTYELKEMTRRGGAGVNMAFIERYPYPIADVFTFLHPYWNGDAGRGTYRGGIFWENQGYAGFLPFLLAMGGAILLFRRDPVVRRFVWVGALAYLLVLGPRTPFYRLCFHVIPGMRMFRFPQRWLYVVDLAIAILAGRTWTGLSRRLEMAGFGPKALRGATVLLLVVTAGDLGWAHFRQVPTYCAERWYAPPASARRILAEGPPRGRVFTAGVLETHYQAYEEAGGWQGSLEPYFEQREFLQNNTGMLHGLNMVDGYPNLTPWYIAEIHGELGHQLGLIRSRIRRAPGGEARWAEDPIILRLLGQWNGEFILSPWPQNVAQLEPLGRFGKAHLYRNRLRLPRAICVGMASFHRDTSSALRRLQDGDYDPASEVVLSEDDRDLCERAVIGAAPGPTGTVEILEDRVETLHLGVEMTRPGFLVLSDSWYPGWTVAVNGRPRPLLRANVCSRAVPLPSGRHELRFSFRSTPLRTGLLLSAGAWLLLLGLLVRVLRRPLPEAPGRARMAEEGPGGSDERTLDEHAPARRLP